MLRIATILFCLTWVPSIGFAAKTNVVTRPPQTKISKLRNRYKKALERRAVDQRLRGVKLTDASLTAALAATKIAAGVLITTAAMSYGEGGGPFVAYGLAKIALGLCGTKLALDTRDADRQAAVKYPQH